MLIQCDLTSRSKTENNADFGDGTFPAVVVILVGSGLVTDFNANSSRQVRYLLYGLEKHIFFLICVKMLN